MIYGTVCSGIEAPSAAWSALGWRPAFFAETAEFPSAVLAHHHPEVPNHGDLNGWREWPDHVVDLLIGGTPCQSFSLIGLRGGLDDERGVLALEYLRLADRLRPRWILWENVAGALSSNGGRDFAALLGGLVKLGYGFAYRVLDAQFVRVDGFERAVPQRRRRVFVVGYLGDWRRAAAVLFERASLSGDGAPRRSETEASPGAVSSGPGASRRLVAYGGANGSSAIEVSTACRAKGGSGHFDFESETFLVEDGSRVRRLTPVECERLQGFPDGFTDIPFRGAKSPPDGPRYRAIGNSMAVNVVRWIGRRIEIADQIAGAIQEAAE